MASANPTRQTTLFNGDVADEKRCSMCGEVKPFACFNKAPNMRLKLTSSCRACIKGRRLALRERQLAEFAEGNVTEIVCCVCRESRPVGEFFRNRGGKYGRDGVCKPCRASSTKATRVRLVQNTEWRRKNQESRHAYNLRRKYGIDRPAYEAMHLAQNGLCAICGKPETAKRRSSGGELKELAVDHDHRTGKIRSLLCSRCNAGLGSFLEDQETMKAAIAYLDRHAAAG